MIAHDFKLYYIIGIFLKEFGMVQNGVIIELLFPWFFNLYFIVSGVQRLYTLLFGLHKGNALHLCHGNNYYISQ